MEHIERLAREHTDVTRRYFLKLSATGLGTVGLLTVGQDQMQGEIIRLQ